MKRTAKPPRKVDFDDALISLFNWEMQYIARRYCIPIVHLLGQSGRKTKAIAQAREDAVAWILANVRQRHYKDKWYVCYTIDTVEGEQWTKVGRITIGGILGLEHSTVTKIVQRIEERKNGTRPERVHAEANPGIGEQPGQDDGVGVPRTV